MQENYNLFVPVIEEYFKGKSIYSRKVKEINVSLSKVQPKRLCGLIGEKAVYGVSVFEEIDRTTSTKMSIELKIGKLIVKKREENLLVDLMMLYETPSWKKPKLTLEGSFVIPLNRE